MTTKLVSLNIGVRLEVEQDGIKHAYEFSAVCPSDEMNQPYDIVSQLETFLEEKLEMQYSLRVETIEIAKPAKIKAPRPISHKAFNRRVKKNMEQLGYKE